MTVRSALPLGFTWLEVLVVCACVALMSSWAWSSHLPLVQRSHRTQARVSLLQAAHWLESAASMQGRYPAMQDIPTSVMQVPGRHYQLHATGDANGYTLRAVPQGTQARDPCGTLTLDHRNQQGMENARLPVHTCWSR